ncbi:UNC44 ankyrin-related protein [Colletotrichum graminicola]|nr:UNC44 ankyrin-related protein [Colletotrichum graminicola]
MIIPNLEVVYPTNITIAPPGWRPKVDIICIHDLGGSPKETWHHDESGKTWISDPDFLGSFNDSAVELYTYFLEHFVIKDLAAGIIFLGTVHHQTDSEGPIVSGRCGELNSGNVKNVFLDCNHFELTRIPSPSSQAHRILTENIDDMTQSILAQDKRRVIFSSPPPEPLNTAGPLPPSAPGHEKLGRSSHMPKGGIIPGPPQRVIDTESFKLWARKRDAGEFSLNYPKLAWVLRVVA